MFSHEIFRFLGERDNTISKSDFWMITDTKENPQIITIKYNSYDDTYEMSTEDDYYFKFRVAR
jgi:hypothetical protein